MKRNNAIEWENSDEEEKILDVNSDYDVYLNVSDGEENEGEEFKIAHGEFQDNKNVIHKFSLIIS